MNEELKERVRNQFSGIAQDYLDSPLFSQGDDLTHVVEAAQLSGNERVLDVGCGAGHTAIALARRAASCVGMDLTESMVAIAEKYAREVGVANAAFCVGDAENLVWPDGTFDLVACRYAVHHFADPRRFIDEAARVLKPGGCLLISDHYAAEDPAIDTYVNHLNRLRDPSHVREPRRSEYRTWFDAAGLSYEEVVTWDLFLDFDDWVARSRTPRDVRDELVRLLQQPPNGAKERQHIEIDAMGGQPRSFSLTCALFAGRKWTTE